MIIHLNYWPRQSGKSEFILRQSKKNDVIICFNLDNTKRMREKNSKLALPIDKYFYSYSQFFDAYRKIKLPEIIGNIWLDEFDFFPIDAQNRLYDVFKKTFPNKTIRGYSSHSSEVSKLITNSTVILHD